MKSLEVVARLRFKTNQAYIFREMWFYRHGFEEAYNNEQDTTCRVIPIKKDKMEAVNMISPPQAPIFSRFCLVFQPKNLFRLSEAVQKTQKISFRA